MVDAPCNHPKASDIAGSVKMSPRASLVSVESTTRSNLYQLRANHVWYTSVVMDHRDVGLNSCPTMTWAWSVSMRSLADAAYRRNGFEAKSSAAKPR